MRPDRRVEASLARRGDRREVAPVTRCRAAPGRGSSPSARSDQPNQLQSGSERTRIGAAAVSWCGEGCGVSENGRERRGTAENGLRTA